MAVGNIKNEKVEEVRAFPENIAGDTGVSPENILESLQRLGGHGFSVIEMGEIENGDSSYKQKVCGHLSVVGKIIVDNYNAKLGVINDEFIETEACIWYKVLKNWYEDGKINLGGAVGYNHTLLGIDPEIEYIHVHFVAESSNSQKFENTKIVTVIYKFSYKEKKKEKEIKRNWSKLMIKYGGMLGFAIVVGIFVPMPYSWILSGLMGAIAGAYE